jgi:DNA invertase Pin-like site-specific DNA recombinase
LIRGQSGIGKSEAVLGFIERGYSLVADDATRITSFEGRELMATLRTRDTVIVARLDRLSRSFIGFAQILDSWTKLKVGIHLCDMPGGHFDPDNPMSEMMIGILIVFANYERRLINQRTKEDLQARKQRDEKYTRWVVRLSLGEARPGAGQRTSTSDLPTRANAPSWPSASS